MGEKEFDLLVKCLDAMDIVTKFVETLFPLKMTMKKNSHRYFPVWTISVNMQCFGTRSVGNLKPPANPEARCAAPAKSVYCGLGLPASNIGALTADEKRSMNSQTRKSNSLRREKFEPTLLRGYKIEKILSGVLLFVLMMTAMMRP